MNFQTYAAEQVLYKTVEHITLDRPDIEPRVSLVGDLWCVLDRKQNAAHRTRSSRDVRVWRQVMQLRLRDEDGPADGMTFVSHSRRMLR